MVEGIGSTVPRGLGAIRVLDVKAMCELYGVSAEMTEAMKGLAAETKSKGWWHAYGDAVPSWFELYVGLESAAAHLRQYEETLIPGLLQTREYALGLARLDRPSATEEERERAVEVRLQRQSLDTGTPVRRRAALRRGHRLLPPRVRGDAGNTSGRDGEPPLPGVERAASGQELVQGRLDGAGVRRRVRLHGGLVVRDDDRAPVRRGAHGAAVADLLAGLRRVEGQGVARRDVVDGDLLVRAVLVLALPGRALAALDELEAADHGDRLEVGGLGVVRLVRVDRLRRPGRQSVGVVREDVRLGAGRAVVGRRVEDLAALADVTQVAGVAGGHRVVAVAWILRLGLPRGGGGVGAGLGAGSARGGGRDRGGIVVVVDEDEPDASAAEHEQDHHGGGQADDQALVRLPRRRDGGPELRWLPWLAVSGVPALRGRRPAPRGYVRIRLPSVRRVTMGHLKPLSLSMYPQARGSCNRVVSAPNRNRCQRSGRVPGRSRRNPGHHTPCWSAGAAHRRDRRRRRRESGPPQRDSAPRVALVRTPLGARLLA
ncbi:Scr1 family TA system antitoxin-like transcriptional regulator [Micromonospora sp. B11E3]|uniref:Scr1 family TA system antitoxin-like transcriptional regulator n=1 Tax=Micromonospora sp. B11E3 TaxID=3153562 RepID=UPI00325D4FDD